MGMYRVNELYPSVWECVQAKEVFFEAAQHYAPCNDMSKACIVQNALAEVWRAGRLYQMAKEQSRSTSETIGAFRRLREVYGQLAVRNSKTGVKRQ